MKSFPFELFRRLLSEVEAGRQAYLGTIVDGEEEEVKGSHTLWNDLGQVLVSEGSIPLIFSKQVGLHSAIVQGKSVEWVVESYSAQPTLLIFGSGHIAESLVTLGKFLSYKVIVVDDRPEYTTVQHFPAADQVICGPFEQVLSTLPIHAGCYAVLATRGHQTDTICLEHLLVKTLPYIGMVGSSRKIQSIKSLLQVRGLDLTEHKNVFAPVGIDMHSETPQEISLSILAEIALLRFGGTGQSLSSLPQHKVHKKDYQRMRQELDFIQVMEQAWSGAETFATVTVVDSSGHVPRGIGTKMLVWKNGRTYQTIGGGRRENEVIALALECIQERRAMKHEVDFSGRYDSYQPVCGGRYTLFIQPYSPSLIEV
ncbi:XdhC/CoxI family protein [Ammoniphilus sp. CFH 90114]|uniref:XdhC family protein n=1 Tax=Ammoniphilus sp. CFH 90114 TaxID=2493665 RepID=UPI00100EF341|nr:XdhC/CoxI family protein [Ammoniphilus sp. CFH 90114]RXT05762.1 hypothetical protein EIZ39_16790 [Ammoniphilus sp. CFH 90114]